MFLLSSHGDVGNFVRCVKCVRDHFGFRRKDGFSLEKPQRKRALARVEGRISCFFSSCGRVPLELKRGHQGPAPVTSRRSSLHGSRKGPIVFPLQSLPELMSSSGVEAGTSGFLSKADMDLRVPLGRLQGSQASSRVESCTSAHLSGQKSSVWVPVVVIVGIGGFLSRCYRAFTPSIVFEVAPWGDCRVIAGESGVYGVHFDIRGLLKRWHDP